DIAEAKAWVARRPKNAPEPTALHLDFIRASEAEAEARSSAQRKQLEEMAAAQAERETALHKAEEALKRAADAQRKRTRIVIALAVVSVFAVLSGWLYWIAAQERKMAEEKRYVAEEQRKVAEEQRKVAEELRGQADVILSSAANIIVRLQTKMD